MYEAFTDRARKVMQLANISARCGSNGGQCIGTEDILIGLIREGSGVAAHVLKTHGITLDSVRGVLENGSSDSRRIPCDYTMVLINGRLPHSPGAKRLIDRAVEEARNLNHKYVGTEHLLLGLLRMEGDGMGHAALVGLGLKPKRVCREIYELLIGSEGVGASPESATAGETSVTRSVVARLIDAERAYQDAKFGSLESREPLTIGEFLLVLRNELNEAVQAWTKAGHGSTDALCEVVQVAAVAVACLETHARPLVVKSIADMEWVRSHGGFVSPSLRAASWWPLLDAIRMASPVIDAEAKKVIEERERRSAETLARSEEEGK